MTRVICCFLSLLFSLTLQAREPQKLSIVDYFLLLPADTFESPPTAWLRFLRQPGCGTVDKANGYMSCTGDGAQAEFEVALFRFNDGRPLLAISSGELEGADSIFLEFFELGKDGHMKKISRNIFPIPDGKGREFNLPQKGRVITVIDEKSKKARSRFSWDGSKFQPVK